MVGTVVVGSSRTDRVVDVVDVTSSSALDVVEINKDLVVVVAVTFEVSFAGGTSTS